MFVLLISSIYDRVFTVTERPSASSSHYGPMMQLRYNAQRTVTFLTF